MLAEARDPDLQGSGAPWQPPAAGEETKDLRNHHRQQGREHRQHTPSRRPRLLGLETRPELLWEDWDLGKEFTKSLALKNTHHKIQRLHLRPPESKFFTTLGPKTIFLSPGMSFSIVISFRPLQRCEYEDSIELQGKEGSLPVRLRATLPSLALDVPDSLLLPLCAIQHSSHVAFQMKNPSKLQAFFQWVCAPPFQFSPDQGLLKPRQECSITVVYQPQEALVHQQKAYCRFGEKEDEARSCSTVQLHGSAKYPYLQLRNPAAKEEKEQGAPVLHFGSVAVGQSLQKQFDIFNPSLVTASFSLSRLSGGVPLLGSEFICDVTGGKVEPGGFLRATVTFNPAVVDTVSVEYLSLKYRGGVNEDLLKLTGSCIGPKLSLSCSVLDFGCVEDGKAVTQTMELVNSSSVESIYQWDLDCSGHSVFRIQPASGTVPPHSRTTVKAVYRPTGPMAHHRRVPCLLLQRDPLFLDLIGTCHSAVQKPAILKPEHLVLYKLHWYRSQNAPDTPSGVQHDRNVDLDQQGLHCTPEESCTSTVVPTTPMEEFYQSCSGSMDTLSSSSSSSPHVSVVPRELLFNHRMSSPCLSTASTSSQSVSITNYMRRRLRLVWTVAQDSPFTVSPSSCDLAPLKSTSFRVTYDPKQLNTLHGAQLECFAFYKMDDNHIDERLLCPPWCVTVRVVGHSFQPGKQHFVPCYSLKPPQVVFPGLSAVSYQTALLRNCGDLPLTFCLDLSSDPALAQSVSVVPHWGLVQPGLHQILTLRTTPTEDSPKRGFPLQLQLNAAKHTEELTVVSVLEKLCVSLEGDGSLYFQPTAVGSRTLRSHHIRNLSRLPLRFQWNIPEPDQELISVEPDAGELHPNEILIQTWSFSPLAEKTYTLQPIVTFWPSRTDGGNKSLLTLKVEGMGSKGFIEAKQAVLDVEETLVGNYRSLEIPLVNNSPCSVSFGLSVEQTLLDEELVSDPEAEPCALQLDCQRGIIASGCTMLLQSTFTPHRRGQYWWKISYQPMNASGFVSSPPQALCGVRAKGVFPTLQVSGVCGGGSSANLNKIHLWKLLSLDSLNQYLLSSTSSAELLVRASTKQSLRSHPSTFTKTMLDFNFSAAPISSEPSTFKLMLHNPGSVPVDWAFLFPEDQQIEFEYWVETGVFSSTELSQMKARDNRLFSISPRSATLQPGQQRAVQFSYSHDSVGTNRFPVVLKLSYGRELLLHLQGETLERNRPCLRFASKRHVFTSVTIGDTSPPRQVYEIYNAGGVPVHYEVDTPVLSQLQIDNFNHPVLCCLSPEGDVPAGETAMLEWIFSPLEAKLYHMDVPIHIQDGDSTLVRFEGCGIQTPALGCSNTLNRRDTKESVPCVRRVPFPGQLAYLSGDRISLGDIPVCSQSSRILFLTNVSHTDTVHYTWDHPQQSNQQVLQIRPERGSLRPGECNLCVVTLTSTDYPAVYRIDFICQVFQEAALKRYQNALQRLEEERKKERDEFTISDMNISESQRNKEPLSASSRKESPFSKYKTLPPICASRGCEMVGSKCSRAERRAQREMAKIQRPPEPPQPALLHLEVTAHSHVCLECLQPAQRQKPKSASSSTPPLPVRLPPPSRSPEKDIFGDILTNLLWDILDDPAFSQSLFTVASKPVTYGPTGRAPSSRPQVISGGTEAGLSEQHSPGERAGTAPLLTRDKQHTEHAPVDVSEDVLLNTLQNLMMEAVRGELVLTGHPRTVSLPPVSTRTRGMSRATTQRKS